MLETKILDEKASKLISGLSDQNENCITAINEILKSDTTSHIKIEFIKTCISEHDLHVSNIKRPFLFLDFFNQA